MRNICRTCLSDTSKSQSIFNDVMVNNETLSIAQMILLCTGLEISTYDEFSHFICDSCIDEVVNSYEYRDKCWSSQLSLMKEYKLSGKYDLMEDDEEIEDFYDRDKLHFIDEEAEECLDEDTHDKEIDVNSQETKETEKYEEIGTIDDIKIEFIDKNVVCEIDVGSPPPPEEIAEKIIRLHPQSKKLVNVDLEINVGSPPSSKEVAKKKVRLRPQSKKKTNDEDLKEYVNITIDNSRLYGKVYACLMCDQTYVRPITIRDHLITIHQVKLKKRKGFECKTCGKVFDTRDGLTGHQKVHFAPTFVCDICGAVLKSKESFIVHQRQHTGEKPYKCKVCDFRAAQKSSMEVHNRVHTGEKPFKCHICGLAFKTSSSRATHRRQHSDERPFECVVCLKTFKTRGCYRGHMKTHDLNNTVECEFCKKRFQPGQIQFHVRQHSATPSYNCKLCGQSFFLRASYIRHMKNRHFKTDLDVAAI